MNENLKQGCLFYGVAFLFLVISASLHLAWRYPPFGFSGMPPTWLTVSIGGTMFIGMAVALVGSLIFVAGLVGVLGDVLAEIVQRGTDKEE